MQRTKVIVYNKLPDRLDHELEAKINGLGLGSNLKVCRTLEELSSKMEEEAGQPQLAVLVPMDREDLESLIALRLGDWQTKIILVLRQRDPEALARGHVLHPRFLTFADCNLTEVAIVARNLVRVSQPNTYH